METVKRTVVVRVAHDYAMTIDVPPDEDNPEAIEKRARDILLETPQDAELRPMFQNPVEWEEDIAKIDYIPYMQEALQEMMEEEVL